MSAQYVCDTGDLEPGEAMRVDIEDADGRPVPVAVVRDEAGDFHAVSDICSHGQVNLSDGEVEDSTIECWLHGSTFDLRTGKPLSLPATQPVPVYAVSVEGDSVLVDITVTVGANA
ncbi:non-heme iron oxygenase ferredoxin subunit [uncultured Georgenia sp.]|uniref:non-heme iron oxygenase ferredoxin subunit n=1 Tax=uncultured Georgenia sp. TaxID=378209 RepID=UPI00260C306B|nr:non-heme iron oxygenase ferredoxin subunit [uncultured Georgenia sp.]HLV04901.1 non-heme iron oxygenase ferredoxin subunit [Actinomycetaceae bacterium]